MNRKNQKKRILILSANPKLTSQLRLDEEMREIDKALRRAQKHDRFELIQRWAVTPRELQRAILEETPEIVHFSGHGVGEEGLARVIGDVICYEFVADKNYQPSLKFSTC